MGMEDNVYGHKVDMVYQMLMERTGLMEAMLEEIHVVRQRETPKGVRYTANLPEHVSARTRGSNHTGVGYL
jgi:hypothetical protein